MSRGLLCDVESVTFEVLLSLPRCWLINSLRGKKKNCQRDSSCKTKIIAPDNMHMSRNSSDPQSKDLVSLLAYLDDRVDRILASLYVLWDLDVRFSEIEKELEQQDYIDVLRSNNEKMEADLGVVERKTRLLGEDRLFEWIDGGKDDEEKEKRQRKLMRLTEKMRHLERQMIEAKEGYLGDGDV